MKNDGFAHVVALVVGAVLLVGGGTAVASDNARPGDALYGVDRAVEEVRSALAITAESKAGYSILTAQERLEEIESLVSENAPAERIEEAKTQFENNLNDALARVESVSEGSVNVDLASQLAENSLRQQAALQEAANSAPGEAQESLQKAMEASQQGFERASEALEQADRDAVVERVKQDIPDVEELLNNNVPDEAEERVEESAEKAQTGQENNPTTQ